MPTELVLHPRGVDADGVAEDRRDVRLVDRAGRANEVAQVPDRPLDIAGEAFWGVLCLPAAAGSQPAGQREVAERDHRLDAALVAGGTDPPVVVERSGRPLVLGRLDTTPFDREPVGGKTEI